MVQKNEDEEVKSVDCFWLSQIYPDAGASLSFYQLPIEEIRDNCVVILDANVLLLPYKLGTQSLDELRKVYGALATADRIFLPGQAVREFLKNRADRVRDVLRDQGIRRARYKSFPTRRSASSKQTRTTRNSSKRQRRFEN
jgi:hypothetical protein